MTTGTDHTVHILGSNQGWIISTHGPAPEPDGCPVQDWLRQPHQELPTPGTWLFRPQPTTGFYTEPASPNYIPQAAIREHLQELAHQLGAQTDDQEINQLRNELARETNRANRLDAYRDAAVRLAEAVTSDCSHEELTSAIELFHQRRDAHHTTTARDYSDAVQQLADERNTNTGLSPTQLRHTATHLRETVPYPANGQDPGQYMVSTGIHALADALDHTAATSE
jgi:hypothetical protein